MLRLPGSFSLLVFQGRVTYDVIEHVTGEWLFHWVLWCSLANISDEWSDTVDYIRSSRND